MDFRSPLLLGKSKLSSETRKRGSPLLLRLGLAERYDLHDHLLAAGVGVACGRNVDDVAVLIVYCSAMRCFVRAAVEHLRCRRWAIVMMWLFVARVRVLVHDIKAQRPLRRPTSLCSSWSACCCACGQYVKGLSKTPPAP